MHTKMIYNIVLHDVVQGPKWVRQLHHPQHLGPLLHVLLTHMVRCGSMWWEKGRMGLDLHLHPLSTPPHNLCSCHIILVSL